MLLSSFLSRKGLSDRRYALEKPVVASNEEGLLTLVAVGDIRPNRQDPPTLFGYCRDALRTADIVFGQMETQLSDRGTPMFTPRTPTKRAPRNISALTEEGAGFDVMSFATNAAMDFGPEAFFDTIDLIERNHIAVVGAGKNIEEARRPVVLERNGTKVGFLAYLSIVFPGLIADDDVPGCAPLRATNSYQQVDYQPGTPPLILSKLIPEDRAAMEEDIKKLRPKVDVLVVSMHCGVHFTPAIIAQYQKEAAYAAIDTGADLVLQHHTHILKGIEVYKGKTIFYGLGNFAAEDPDRAKKIKSSEYVASIRKFYRIKPIPGWEMYRFHPDSRNTLIAKAYIRDKKIEKVSYIPTYIRPSLEPEVVTRKDPRGQGVFDYVQHISGDEDLNVRFSWDGDEVLVT